MAKLPSFKKIKEHAQEAAKGLWAWNEGLIKPETEDEAICARIVRTASASIIVQYARLGVDVVGIYNDFLKEQQALDKLRALKNVKGLIDI